MTVPVSSFSAAADPHARAAEEATAATVGVDSATEETRGPTVSGAAGRRRDRVIALLVLVLAVAVTVALLVPLWLRPASGTVAP